MRGEGTQRFYMKDVFSSEFTEFLSEIKERKRGEKKDIDCVGTYLLI